MFTWYCRMIFKAVSTASDPPLARNTLFRSPGASSANFFDSLIVGTAGYAKVLA